MLLVVKFGARDELPLTDDDTAEIIPVVPPEMRLVVLKIEEDIPVPERVVSVKTVEPDVKVLVLKAPGGRVTVGIAVGRTVPVAVPFKDPVMVNVEEPEVSVPAVMDACVALVEAELPLTDVDCCAPEVVVAFEVPVAVPLKGLVDPTDVEVFVKPELNVCVKIRPPDADVLVVAPRGVVLLPDVFCGVCRT